MRPVFSFDEIRDAESRIIREDSVPSLILMENAGKNSYEQIVNRYPDIDDYDIYIITGKGNNAGDGFVIGRHMLLSDLPVTLVMAAGEEELKGDALVNFYIFKKENNRRNEIVSFDHFLENVNKHSKVLIIDSILGSGIKGKLSSDFSHAINSVNKLRQKNKKLRTVSIDVPSGLMSGQQINPVIQADMTITMGALKTELLYGEGKDCAGDIYVIPIGISDEFLNRYNADRKFAVDFYDAAGMFPRRKKSSYKYSNGKVVVIGGSTGLSGAVIMSAISALRSGAGAVTAAVPESIASHFSRKLPDIIKLILPNNAGGSISAGAYDVISKRLESADAVLLGPGISVDRETKSFVFDVIKKCDKNLVIDADALTLIAEDPAVLIHREYENEIILTPHIGEFSRMSGVSSENIMLNRFKVCREFAAKHKVNVVMKSETTFSCLKTGEVYINTSGNESLGVVGSGDVLSGILVSLLAQTKDVLKTLICGNYLHGFCSELYYEKYGNKQSASQQDFIKLIPKAVTHFVSDEA